MKIGRWKKSICLLSILMVFLSLSFHVNATAGEFSLELKTPQKEVQKGETVEVAIHLVNVKGVSPALNACKATINYDTTMFEEIKQSDFITQNQWQRLRYNPQTRELVVIKPTKAIQDEEIVKVKLKVKKDSSLKNAKISLNTVSLSGGKEDVKPIAEDVSVSVDVVEQVAPKPPVDNNKPGGNGNLTPPTNGNNEGNGSNGGQNIPSVNGNVNNQTPSLNNNQTTGNGMIGSANSGQEDNSLLLIGLLLGSALVLVIIIIKRKQTKKSILGLLVFGLLCSQFTIISYANDLKGDVNNNKALDVEDVVLLQQHLIHEKALSTEQEVIGDINQDKQITVTDLSLLIEKVKFENEDSNVTVTIVPSLKEKYAEKGAVYQFVFDTKQSGKQEIEEITINDVAYPVIKLDNGKYAANINVNSTAGVQEFTVSKVKLANQQMVEIKANFTIEVLKTKPNIEGFVYKKEGQNIKVEFNFVDVDKASTKASLKVKTKDKVVKTIDQLTLGKNEFSFAFDASQDVYEVIVEATYDLDSNKISTSDNAYTNSEIYRQSIVLSGELLQYKDIESVALYTKKGSTVEEVNEVTVAGFNPSNYVVKVSMKDMPAFYSEIESAKVNDKKEFLLKLKQNNVVQYKNGIAQEGVEVAYGVVENGVSKYTSVEKFVKTIKEQPNATIVLTSDINARDLPNEAKQYFSEFTGTIDGNGYSIRNLRKPLFQNLKNATIKNLVIEDADIGFNQRGILANNATGSTIENVHIVNSKIKADHQDGTGGFIGVIDSTKILNSSADQIIVEGAKRVGGFVGYMNNGSTIENSYVTGSIKATKDAAGGIAGETTGKSSVIKNSYVNIEFIGGWDNGSNAAIVGYSGQNSIVLQNNLVKAKGKFGFAVAGTGTSRESKNNKVIKEEAFTIKNPSSEEYVEGSKINQEYFQTTMQWNPSIWKLDQVSATNLPKLVNGDVSDKLLSPKNPSIYLPDFNRLKQMENYIEANEIAYYNMYKLMPFYDSKFIVLHGNKLASDAIMKEAKIKMILPYDAKGNMVISFNEDNKTSISKIKVVFENDKSKDYQVSYKQVQNQIAEYTISSLQIPYMPNKYVLKNNHSIISEIVNEANKLDYANSISKVTEEEESRLYVDYYNQTAKAKVGNFIVNLLSNDPDYTLSINNDIVAGKIKKDLLSNSNLQKLLYTFNYFDKWYHMEFGNVALSDFILYFLPTGEISMDTSDWVSVVLSQDRKTNRTVEFYNGAIKPKVGNKDLKQFLDFAVQLLANQSGADWFTQNFKGILEERAIVGKENEVRYRAWDNMGARNHLMLPILSAPQEDMYIVSVPSQFIFGSTNRYNIKFNEGKEAMANLVKINADRYGNFYNTSSKFIKDSYKRLNGKVNIHYDTRMYFPKESGYEGVQDPLTTEDPVMKWVYEAIDKWAAKNGTAAYADGTDVYWVDFMAMGSDYTFEVATHEIAHNQDGPYFYEGHGRRSGTGGEDHADANIAQEAYDGSFVFNLKQDYPITSDLSNNLLLSSIDSPEKIKNYYSGMFETIYVLDYLVGEAFLALTPEEQAKLAVQVSYEGNTDLETGGSVTKYTKLTADQIKKMNLETIEDLYNNGLVLRNEGTVGTNKYGGEGHYNVYWYQPHNNNGRSDANTFKRVGFEMLGVGGYSDGYVTYRSTKSSNDLDALRKITNKPNITWKDYKLGRFKHVEKMLDTFTYFDKDAVIMEFYTALKLDSKVGDRKQIANVRKALFGIIKRATKDFSTGSIYENRETIKVNTAEQLIEAIKNNPWGTFELTADIDFSNIKPVDGVYIQNTFVGRILGKNFKFKGVKATLFKTMHYGSLQDVIIESPVYEPNINAYFAKLAKDAIIYNVTINNSNRGLRPNEVQEGKVLRMNVVTK